jgi:hypothetical protein
MSGGAAKRGRDDDDDEELDKLRPVPEPAAKWYWKEEPHRIGQHDKSRTLKPNWVEYDTGKTVEIEKAFRAFKEQGGAATLSMTIAGKAITVQFAKMEQVNDATGWKRKMHRVQADVIVIEDDSGGDGGCASKKQKGDANSARPPAKLVRRNSSGSMGAPNTAVAAAGGKDKVQDKTIEKMIALAKNWEPDNKKHDPTGMIMSEKLDGVRCFWNGKGLYTRTGHLIPAPANFVQGFPSDMFLDGELFIDRGKFNEVSGLARTLQSEPRAWKPVTYVVFDAPQVKGGLMTRLAAAKAKLDGVCKFARILEQVVCKGHDHVIQELARIEALVPPGEGLMLRHPTAEHKGGRSADLLKVKTQHDAEAVVTGHEQVCLHTHTRARARTHTHTHTHTHTRVCVCVCVCLLFFI